MSISQVAVAAAVAARNVLWGGTASALRLIHKPTQLAALASENLFLYRTFTDGRGVPQRNVWDVLDGDRTTSITLAHEYYWPWFGTLSTYAADLVNLCVLSRILQPSIVFEVGTSRGLTALHFALNAPAARVFTLDLPIDRPVTPQLRTTLMDSWHIRGTAEATGEHVFDGRPEAERIERLYGDSATFDFSRWHGQVDLFFIDGAHSYEYVRSDTDNALRCVRPGGVIAWHDFGRAGVNGVSRVVLEMGRAGHQPFAVPGGSLAFMRVGQEVAGP